MSHDATRRDAADADERIDALARERGSELRRPAPARGLAHVHAVRRRRQVTRVAAGTGAVILVAVGLNAALADDDGSLAPAATGVSTVATSSPTTTTPTTTTPTTTTPTTTTPTTTTPTTVTLPPPTAAPTTVVVEVPPNAAGRPDVLYWTTGLGLPIGSEQTVVDPGTGAVVRTEPIDGEVSLQAQTDRTARFVASPVVEGGSESFATYRFEVGDIAYSYVVRYSDASPLDETDPADLARFDRCGQSELVVEGAAGSALPARVRDVAVSVDGRWLATTGGDCPVAGTLEGQTQYVDVAERVEIFDATRPDLPGRTLFTSSGNVGSVFFSPDGRYAAVDTEPGYRVFDLADVAEIAVGPSGCRAFGGRYARFDGPWAGSSSLVLAVNCPGQPAAMLVTDLATGEVLRVPVPADAGFPDVGEVDGPALTVEVDVAHFDRPANAWFTLCAWTPEQIACWYGQGGSEPVRIPDAAEASFLPLGFTYGG